MPAAVLLDVFNILDTSAICLTLVVGSLTTLFSAIYLGRRVLRPRSVRARLRAGLFAAVMLIALAGLDVYLAISKLIGS